MQVLDILEEHLVEAFGGDSLERIDDSAPSSARHAAVQSFNAPPRQGTPKVSKHLIYRRIGTELPQCSEENTVSSFHSRRILSKFFQLVVEGLLVTTV